MVARGCNLSTQRTSTFSARGLWGQCHTGGYSEFYVSLNCIKERAYLKKEGKKAAFPSPWELLAHHGHCSLLFRVFPSILKFQEQPSWGQAWNSASCVPKALLLGVSPPRPTVLDFPACPQSIQMSSPRCHSYVSTTLASLWFLCTYPCG